MSKTEKGRDELYLERTNSRVIIHPIFLKLLDIIPIFDECQIETFHVNCNQHHDHKPKRSTRL